MNGIICSTHIRHDTPLVKNKNAPIFTTKVDNYY